MKREETEMNHGLYLICSTDGKIREVLFDDLNLIDKEKLPTKFSDILNKNSISKADEFWKEVQKNDFEQEYELYVQRDKREQFPLKFSAGKFKNQVWVLASSGNTVMENMLVEMMLINNEQQNLLRRAEKKLSNFIKKSGEQPFDDYDEISRVNNELVNAQRKLIKQNEEILRLNSELQNINMELEHFTHTISHDLKEPLRMVKSFMNLLNDKYQDELDEKAQKYIYYAVDGAERMEKLINDLLEYSRVGRINKEKEKTDINKVLEQVVNLNRSFIEECNASVKWDDMPIIKCQKVPVEQLFNNLLTNSLKYRKNDTEPVIEIKVEEEQEKWLFSVSDNGRGIDPEYYKVIFDLFRRIDDDEAGSGMGLAICEKIVKQHGGEIWVESEKGKGSTFFFTLEKF